MIIKACKCGHHKKAHIHLNPAGMIESACLACECEGYEEVTVRTIDGLTIARPELVVKIKKEEEPLTCNDHVRIISTDEDAIIVGVIYINEDVVGYEVNHPNGLKGVYSKSDVEAANGIDEASEGRDQPTR